MIDRIQTSSEQSYENQTKMRGVSRADHGSTGHGSLGQMGHFFEWVRWVMGQCIITRDPQLIINSSK